MSSYTVHVVLTDVLLHQSKVTAAYAQEIQTAQRMRTDRREHLGGSTENEPYSLDKPCSDRVLRERGEERETQGAEEEREEREGGSGYLFPYDGLPRSAPEN